MAILMHKIDFIDNLHVENVHNSTISSRLESLIRISLYLSSPSTRLLGGGLKNKEGVLSIEMSRGSRDGWDIDMPAAASPLNVPSWTSTEIDRHTLVKFQKSQNIWGMFNSSVSICSPTSISHASNKWKIRSLENSEGNKSVVGKVVAKKCTNNSQWKNILRVIKY